MNVCSKSEAASQRKSSSTSWWHRWKSSRNPKVIGNNLPATMNVFESYNNPTKSCWDISAWTKVENQPTGLRVISPAHLKTNVSFPNVYAWLKGSPVLPVALSLSLCAAHWRIKILPLSYLLSKHSCRLDLSRLCICGKVKMPPKRP